MGAGASPTINSAGASSIYNNPAVANSSIGRLLGWPSKGGSSGTGGAPTAPQNTTGYTTPQFQTPSTPFNYATSPYGTQTQASRLNQMLSQPVAPSYQPAQTAYSYNPPGYGYQQPNYGYQQPMQQPNYGYQPPMQQPGMGGKGGYQQPYQRQMQPGMGGKGGDPYLQQRMQADAAMRTPMVNDAQPIAMSIDEFARSDLMGPTTQEFRNPVEYQGSMRDPELVRRYEQYAGLTPQPTQPTQPAMESPQDLMARMNKARQVGLQVGPTPGQPPNPYANMSSDQLQQMNAQMQREQSLLALRPQTQAQMRPQMGYGGKGGGDPRMMGGLASMLSRGMF